jgi:hypothetical protein
MQRIRTIVYAAMLALAAMSFTPSLAAADETARGKFTLTHNVRWGSAVVPAGDYEFSYDPSEPSPVLTITKINGTHAAFMMLVTNTEASKPSDSNQLLLQTGADGSYVSTMQLAECGITLHFMVPSHSLKQLAKAAPAVATSGQ